MLEKTTRDVALVPALQPAMDAFADWLDDAAGALLRGSRYRGGRRRRARAAIGHALAFGTWRSLVRDQGLAEPEAVELVLAMVRAAANRPAVG